MKKKLTILLWLVAIASGVLLGQTSKPYNRHSTWGIAYDKVESTSVELKDGKLIVSWREESHGDGMWPEGGGPSPDIKAWRDIYCASNGVVVLERTENGAVIPARTKTQTDPEKVEWPK